MHLIYPGTVDIGKKADLVLLDANPLEDIANTRSINTIVSRGRVLSRDNLSNLIVSGQETLQ